jgi:hypothetical protein
MGDRRKDRRIVARPDYVLNGLPTECIRRISRLNRAMPTNLSGGSDGQRITTGRFFQANLASLINNALTKERKLRCRHSSNARLRGGTGYHNREINGRAK